MKYSKTTQYLMAAAALSMPFSAISAEKSDVDVYYDGLTNIVTADGNTHLKVEMRVQTRVSSPFDNNPSSISGLTGADATNFEVNRSRIKAGGHVLKPWVKLKFEYDTEASRLLDFRLTLKHSDELQFRFGRMKAHYSLERVASSKDQMMVDRSMVNDYFTVDRQQGVSLLGRVGKKQWYDFNYWLDVFNGTGREGGNENSDLMIGGRYQWNIFGESLKSAMGDLSYREKPAAHLAYAFSTNTSRYTKFSSSGGGSLQNFDLHQQDDGFKISQWLLEGRYQYKGMSVDVEYHQKTITDQYNTLSDYYQNYTGGDKVEMRGAMAQVGVHPHAWLQGVAKNLQLTARYAQVDPDTNIDHNQLNEITLGANWYFSGHRNKITFDIGRYEVQETDVFGVTNAADDTRVRLQHDISF
ncbi:porin [Thalassotalea sp. PLHSN55]|uniref:porin n=1 Tax=Thalassotalea sp. PLHSN55 TaxID=3435888 RepID=UPI003F8669E6